MDLEESLKQLEISANQVAKDWRCIYCNENSLKYISISDGIYAGGEDFGIEYKCESCGGINRFDEVKNYGGNKR